MRPDTFSYLTLKEAISVWGIFLKEGIGVRELGRKTKLSAGYLSEVLSGKKVPSKQVFLKFSVAGIWSVNESLYLETLSLLDQAKNPDEEFHYFRRLNEIAKNHPIHQRWIREGQSLSFWFLSSVRKLLMTPPQRFSTLEIKKRIKGIQDLTELKEGLQIYTELGLIQKNSDQTYSNSDRYRHWGAKGTKNPYLQQFHQRVLSRTTEALKDPVEQRDFQAMTFLADKDEIQKMKQSIDDFLNHFYEKYSHEARGKVSSEDSVFQFNTQLYLTSQEDSAET